MTVRLASIPFPSQELGTLAPNTRTVFHSEDTYETGGERSSSSSSSSLGGKKENIFFCWIGVEIGLRACIHYVEKPRWQKDNHVWPSHLFHPWSNQNGGFTLHLLHTNFFLGKDDQSCTHSSSGGLGASCPEGFKVN